MRLLAPSLVFVSLATLTSAITSASQFRAPRETLPNGATNPFYPCGLTPSACPYRCYNDGTLLKPCYDRNAAARMQQKDGIICVACVKPLASEIPKSNDSKATCQPLRSYFSSQSVDGPRPARCGTRKDPIAACAWNCAEAQVPFNVCSRTNDTGEFEKCVKCKPGCSSPVVSLQGGSVPSADDFSVSEGVCGTEDQTVRNQACPWRCKDAGNPNRYCSLVNKSVDGGFTSCRKCPSA